MVAVGFQPTAGLGPDVPRTACLSMCPMNTAGKLAVAPDYGILCATDSWSIRVVLEHCWQASSGTRHEPWQCRLVARRERPRRSETVVVETY